MKKYKSYLFALVSIFFWASSATVTKLLVQDVDSLQILCIATLFASITLFLINIFNKKISVLKTYKLKDFLKCALLGFIGVFFYYFCFNTAIYYLPAQEAFIINYLWPIMIVVFSIIILKEHFTFKKLLAMIISFIGILIVLTKGNVFSLNLSNLLGIFLAFMCAVSYGLFAVLDKKNTYDKTVSMMLYYIFALLFSFIAMLLFSDISKVNGFHILGFAWTGIFNYAIGYTTWSFALKYGNTSKISNLAFITPFLSLIYIFIFLGEKISIYSFIGLIIIVLGILIQNKDLKKENKIKKHI